MYDGAAHLLVVVDVHNLAVGVAAGLQVVHDDGHLGFLERLLVDEQRLLAGLQLVAPLDGGGVDDVVVALEHPRPTAQVLWHRGGLNRARPCDNQQASAVTAALQLHSLKVQRRG